MHSKMMYCQQAALQGETALELSGCTADVHASGVDVIDRLDCYACAYKPEPVVVKAAHKDAGGFCR